VLLVPTLGLYEGLVQAAELAGQGCPSKGEHELIIRITD
jgi:hypothetical protein